ncbi:hypothetical protein Tco_1431040 [Tanacetum coccineum]
MSMTIQSSVKDKILATSSETSKYEYEICYHPSKANVVTDALSKKERVKPRRVRAMAMTIQYGVRGMILTAQSEVFKQENVPLVGSEMDEAHASRLRWTVYPVLLADAAESVRDAIGFESSVLWGEIEESSLIGPELVQEMTDKVVLIKEKLRAARDRQKSYANNRRKPLEFEVGDQVMLKLSPWKGVIRFGKKGKLAPSSNDDKSQSDNEDESDLEHETDDNEYGSESDQEEDDEKIEDDEEEEEEEIVKTPSNDSDDEDETKIANKAKADKDEEMDYTTSLLYDDVDIRMNEPVDADKGFVQEECTDASMTNKAEVLVSSSSRSSDFTAKFLNFSNIPTTEAEIVSPLDVPVHHEVPNHQTPTLLTVPVSVIFESSLVISTVILQSFTPPLLFRVTTLEQEVVVLKKDPFHTQVTDLVDEHLDVKLGATKDEFMNFLSASLIERITEQVKIQLL